MIHGITSNKSSFRSVKFTSGLNLIVADRSADAGEKDTTNALGKSTLIDILDFCLGSSPGPNKGLRIEPLNDWKFSLDITLGESRVVVTRAVSDPGFIEIDGDTSGWPILPEFNGDEVRGLSVSAWRQLLGMKLFRLSTVERSLNYKPSGRSLLSYFLRNQSSAYDTPFKYFANQKTWDIQLHNSLLLGLDWERAVKWQTLKDQKTSLDALKKAIKTGAIQGELSSIGELEAQLLNLEDQLQQEDEAIASFRVLPQYRQIQTEANRITSDIHSFLNANVSDRRRVDLYEAALTGEGTPSEKRVEELYQDAGVSLPDAVVRTLSEAREFNRQIISNRRGFIEEEILALRARVAERDEIIETLTGDRATYMTALSEHGALEELTALQALNSQTRQKLDDVRNRIHQLRQMTTRADEIKVATVELKKATELDYAERRPTWSKALRMFAEYSEHLYEAPGRLVIDIDDTGYRFDVEIAGSPSEGISKMKIFCYDLVLVALARERSLGIDFLVHDSTIFDGVDPRQRAHALELAATTAESRHFQYICTINSDMVPINDFSDGFDHENYIRLVLTDNDAAGSLLGFRY